MPASVPCPKQGADRQCWAGDMGVTMGAGGLQDTKITPGSPCMPSALSLACTLCHPRCRQIKGAIAMYREDWVFDEQQGLIKTLPQAARHPNQSHCTASLLTACGMCSRGVHGGHADEHRTHVSHADEH